MGGRAATLCLALLVAPPAVCGALKVDPEGWLAKAKDKLGDKAATVGGEVGIGFGAGFACGFVCKKVQGAVQGVAFVGAGLAGGACAMGLTTPEDLMNRARKAQSVVEANFDKLRGAAEKEMPDLDESKVTLTAFAKKHRGATAGACAHRVPVASGCRMKPFRAARPTPSASRPNQVYCCFFDHDKPSRLPLARAQVSRAEHSPAIGSAERVGEGAFDK